MENTLANKIGTIRSVNSTNAEFHTKWENFPIFVTYAGILNNAQTVIEEDEEIIEGITSGTTTDKEQKEKAMVVAALKVSATGYAYAVDTNNETLAGKMNVTKSDFAHKLAEEEVGLAGEIYDAIHPIIGSLTDYPITPADLADLLAKKTAFSAVITAPKDVRHAKKEAKVDIKKQIKIAFDVFDKWDKLMVIFDNDADAAYFNKYWDSRMIIDSGKGHATALLTFKKGTTEPQTMFDGKIEAGDSILVRNHSPEDIEAGLTDEKKKEPITTPALIKRNTDVVLLVPNDANVISCRILSIVAHNKFGDAKVTVFLIKGVSRSNAGQVELSGIPK